MAVGTLFVVRMLAPFLISPIAGVVADRYNRKNTLIVTDITRALTVVGFLFVRSADQIWLLYTLTAIQLGISGFFFPTRNAILPDLVSQRELGAANALSSATWSVMLALGAATGGLVSGIFGIYTAFTVDALTFSALSSLYLSNYPRQSAGARDRQHDHKGHISTISRWVALPQSASRHFGHCPPQSGHRPPGRLHV